MDNGNDDNHKSTASVSFKMGFSVKKNNNNIKGSKRKGGSLEENDESKESIDFVTSISETGIQSVESKQENIPLVIPLPKENIITEVPERFRNLVQKQPKQPKNEEEVLSNLSEEDRQAAKELLEQAKGKHPVEEQQILELPLLLKYRNTNLDHIEEEGERFKADVESRPDTCNLEDYEKIPVTEFGTALLRGMGWSPGAPIGLTNPQSIQPIEFVPRPGWRTGLGATPKPQELPNPTRIRKPGEPEFPKEAQVLPIDSDGKVRHVRRIDEKLVPQSKADKTKIREGSLVGIMSGLHEGLSGIILKMNLDHVIVRLEPSLTVVKVFKEDIMLLNSQQISQLDEEDKDQEKTSKKDSNSKINSWIYPNLIVRIVSKSFAGGKYYLKKGEVIDIINRDLVTVQIAETNTILEVKTKILETVIPQVGGKVLIVEGNDKGYIGKLMSKTKNEATIQLTTDLSISNYSFDSICHYIGNALDYLKL